MAEHIRHSTETVPSRYGGTYERPVIEVRCCGAWMECSGRFTVTCDACDADYNGSGQRLAPRRYWGEETGEHPNDCY